MRRRSSCPGTPLVSSPSISTRPAEGSTRRLIMRSTVDLPEPEVPTMTQIEPLGITIETLSTTVRPS